MAPALRRVSFAVVSLPFPFAGALFASFVGVFEQCAFDFLV